jgi:uncharacterized protein YlaI
MLKQYPAITPIKQMVPDYLFGCQGVCTYCGDICNEIDHVIPVSFFDGKVVRTSNMRGKGVRTYACRECNGILSNKYFENFLDRCRYVNKKISQKYKRILNLPIWEEQEFKQLGKNIKSKLAEKLNLKAIVLERIRWQSTNEFDEYRKEPKDYFDSQENIAGLEWMREYFAFGAIPPVALES